MGRGCAGDHLAKRFAGHREVIDGVGKRQAALVGDLFLQALALPVDIVTRRDVAVRDQCRGRFCLLGQCLVLAVELVDRVAQIADVTAQFDVLVPEIAGGKEQCHHDQV